MELELEQEREQEREQEMEREQEQERELEREQLDQLCPLIGHRRRGAERDALGGQTPSRH